MDTANYIITYKLDTRRAKSRGLYPVKLNVYSTELQKQKYYNTNFNFTEREFQGIWETVKPRSENIEDRLRLQAFMGMSNDIPRGIKPFSFESFERKYYRGKGDGNDVFYHYSQIIKKNKDSNRFGTASNYDLSMKSLKNFILHVKGREADSLSFTEITSDWLSDYESYMINDKKLSRTTVAIYLRPLRAVFNSAISDNEVDASRYPFGSKKYTIPAVKKVKKALNAVDLKKLFKSKAETPEQKKAKDFWFFSYACNGMNIKDIAQLRWKDVKEETITFYRAKTINTAVILTPVTVYLNEYTMSILEKYGSKNKNKNELVFSIISDDVDELTKFIKVQNFTKFINQNLKKLASKIGITEDISTYWARHSFATNAIRKGASMEFVSEALNHRDLRTTQGYFAGFEDKDKKELMQQIMNF